MPWNKEFEKHGDLAQAIPSNNNQAIRMKWLLLSSEFFFEIITLVS